MNYLVLHILGVVLVVASLAYAAVLLGASPHWIGVLITFAGGLGLIGIAKGRRP